MDTVVQSATEKIRGHSTILTWMKVAGRTRYATIISSLVLTAFFIWAFAGQYIIPPKSIVMYGPPDLEFEMGRIDCYLLVKPEVEEVPLKFDEPIKVKVFITYYARPPAPEEIEVLVRPEYPIADFGVTYTETLSNGTQIKKPLMASDIVAMGFVSYEPDKFTIKANETAVMRVIIEFPEEAKPTIEKFKSGGVERLPILISPLYIVGETQLTEKYGFGVHVAGELWVVIDSEA